MVSSASTKMMAAGRTDLLQYGKTMRHPAGYIAGQLELTSKCEQRCPSCQSWIDHNKGLERGELTLQQTIGILDDLSTIPTFEHLTLTGGDPLSWPYFEDLLLRWHQYKSTRWKFKLRINTALPLPVDPDLPWNQLDGLRVSLDGVDREHYRKCRGVDTDPFIILDRMSAIRHPHTDTLTCVSQRNIDHIPDIIGVLSKYRNHNPLRKAIFIPIRDANDRQLIEIELRPQDFQRKWSMLRKNHRLHTNPLVHDWTSFGEQLGEKELSKHKGVRCAVSGITFHIKSTGDIYTCCLMGGEALQTRKEFGIGNVLETPINRIWANHMAHSIPENVYDDPESPCSRICLWKQGMMNLLAHEAEDITLSMP